MQDAREDFNERNFHKRLVDFIVADDQVCLHHMAFGLFTDLSSKSIRLVECREFRDLLLLLRSDLRDSMIPHRSKVRELVLNSWSIYFAQLRLNLEVRVLSKLLWRANIPCPACCGPNIVHM